MILIAHFCKNPGFFDKNKVFVKMKNDRDFGLILNNRGEFFESSGIGVNF